MEISTHAVAASTTSKHALIPRSSITYGFTVVESLFMIVTVVIFGILCLGVTRKKGWWPFQDGARYSSKLTDQSTKR